LISKAVGAIRPLSLCFPPDTPVASETGLRRIGEIEAGDRVWGYDFEAGSWRLCEVDCRHDSNYNGQLVTLDVGVDEVTATSYHPFWVIEGEDLEGRPALRHVGIKDDRDGALAGRWVNSHDLREGDVVFIRTGRAAAVGSVRTRDVSLAVCNLTVRGLHTFAVGNAQILVHNTSGSVNFGNFGGDGAQAPTGVAQRVLDNLEQLHTEAIEKSWNALEAENAALSEFWGDQSRSLFNAIENLKNLVPSGN
jgi:hypothetical protein